jgi:hypothetical protein
LARGIAGQALVVAEQAVKSDEVYTLEREGHKDRVTPEGKSYRFGKATRNRIFRDGALRRKAPRRRQKKDFRWRFTETPEIEDDDVEGK